MGMAAAPDAAACTRFADDLTAALGHAPAADTRLALAVSGGPDSMAMLALAATAFPGRVVAATVDHRLRPDSADEARMVADACASLAVPHAVLRPDAPIAAANLHANARMVRYRLLEDWAAAAGATLLLTAHHADDQAETFLMRAARGSGVAGLGGIRATQPGIADARVTIVRPLLGWRRAELRAIAEASGLGFADDPSNSDPRFDRSRFRAIMAAHPELDVANLARAATHAAEADRELRDVQQWLWQTRRVDGDDDQCWIDMAGLPRELRRRLARAAIAEVRTQCGIARPEFSPASNVEALLDALGQGKSATQAGVMAVPKDGIWRFSAAPPRRSV